MPVYLTGRTRTLTLTGALHGSASLTSVLDMPGYPGPHPNYDVSTAVTGQVVISCFEDDLGTASSITIQGTNTFGNRGVGPPSVLHPQTSDLVVQTVTGLGDTDTATGQDSRTSLGTTTVSAVGTFTISVGTEEFFEENLTLSTTVDGFGAYGGTGYDDGPLARGIRFRERMKVGETLTVTATAGSVTCTSTNVIGAAVTVTDYRVRIASVANAEGSGQDSVWGASGCYFGASLLEIPDYLYQGAEGYVDCTTGCKVQATGSNSELVRTSAATALTYPIISYRLIGTVCTMEEMSYTGGTITIIWFQKNSGVSDSELEVLTSGPVDELVEQHRYSASGYYGSTATPNVTLNEHGPTAQWFKGSSLTANGEDERDWRILCKGKLYDSFTITHADYTVDDGSSAAEWTTTATSVASAGGAIVITTGGAGPYTATKTPVTPYSWEYHRYLKVKIKSTNTANQAYTVVLGSKTWNKDYLGAALQTVGTGTYVEQIIDLCCPTSTSATTDGQYTRWAETAAGSGHSATEGELWGVNWPTTIVLGNLQNNEIYSVDAITLVRGTFANYSVLPGFLNWQQAYPAGASTTYFLPHFNLDVDGRISDRGYHMTNTVTGGIDSYAEPTLTNLISILNGCTGMTCVTVGAFPSDGYHDNSRPAAWIGGGGYLYNIATDPPETTQIDVSMVSATVKAQALWDEVEGYPGMGNAWDGVAYPSSGAADNFKALPIRIVPIRRGQAIGICHQTNTSALVDATVKAYESTSLAEAGIGTTDAQGYYQTGPLYGKGDVSHKTELQQDPTPYLSVTHTWEDRLRVRASFRRDGTTVSNPARDAQDDFRHYRVFSR